MNNMNTYSSLEELLIKISEDKISEDDASPHILNLLNNHNEVTFNVKDNIIYIYGLRMMPVILTIDEYNIIYSLNILNSLK